MSGGHIVTDAFEARALQHEIDHCNESLFLDRVAGAHALHTQKVYLEAPAGAAPAVDVDLGRRWFREQETRTAT